MRWYRKWYLNVNDTDHMRDITCNKEDGTNVLMKNVSLDDMYCPKIKDTVPPEDSYYDYVGEINSSIQYHYR